MWISGEAAWIAIAGAVVIHEAVCGKDELLSDAADRCRSRHPVIVHAFVLATAAHLLRKLPRQLDAYSYVPYVTVHVLPKYRRNREQSTVPARPQG